MDATCTNPSRHRTALTPATRALVERHLHLVDNVARRVAKRPSPQLFDDLRSCGNEALVLAGLRFDESLGVPFQAFAISQIRWAMLNRLRGERLVARHHVDSVQGSDGVAKEWVPLAARCDLRGRTAHAFGEDAVVLEEEQGRRTHLVQTQLMHLNPKERSVVVSRYFEDTDLKEQVGPKLSYATVRRRHKTALAKLETRIRASESRSPTLH